MQKLESYVLAHRWDFSLLGFLRWCFCNAILPKSSIAWAINCSLIAPTEAYLRIVFLFHSSNTCPLLLFDVRISDSTLSSFNRFWFGCLTFTFHLHQQQWTESQLLNHLKASLKFIAIERRRSYQSISNRKTKRKSHFSLSKMATVHKVSGYDAFVSFIGDLVEKNPKSQINVYFTGNKLESGKSWCPDCNDGKHLNRNDQNHSNLNSN